MILFGAGSVRSRMAMHPLRHTPQKSSLSCWKFFRLLLIAITNPKIDRRFSPVCGVTVMSTPADLETRTSLLERLGRTPSDPDAWREFAVHYGAIVLDWCRKWQLQDADAQDVTQNVMLKLAEKIQSFAYDPARSFRGWLRTLAHHAWADFVASRQRPGRGTGDSAIERILDSALARDDLTQRLE